MYSNYLPLFCWKTLLIRVMRSSMGCSEIIQTGRKSQLRRLAGKYSGTYIWSKFTVATNINRTNTGTPIPAITFHPAMERANTRAGRSRKQRRRYKTANQRYLLKNFLKNGDFFGQFISNNVMYISTYCYCRPCSTSA